MVRWVVAALALAALFAGVAGATTGRAQVANPCRLVTAADARGALGHAVRPGKLQLLGLYRSCFYATTGSATLTVQDRALTRVGFVASAKANGHVVRVALPGAAAYWFGAGDTLLAWKHGTEVTFLLFGATKPLPAAKRVATKALGRL